MTRLIQHRQRRDADRLLPRRRRRGALHQDPDHALRPKPVPVRRPHQGLRAGLRGTAARGAAAVHGLHPVLHHPGHQRPRAAGRAAAGAAASPIRRWSRAWRHPGPGGSAGGAGRRSVGGDQPRGRRRGAGPRAARAGQRPVRARGQAPGHRGERRGRRRSRRPASSGCCCGSTPGICSARSRCCFPGNSSPTPTISAGPGRACSTRSCIRPWSGSCSTPTGGCETPGPASRCGSSATTAVRPACRSPPRSRRTARAARRPGGHPRPGGHYGLRHLVMLDVGGTTTDIGVVSDGAIHVERRGTIEHAPSSLELAAITSYGVGGSSVFRVVDGRLRVGPDSVGAAPGPACFGLGGDQADDHRRAAAGRPARSGDLPGRHAAPAPGPGCEGDRGQDRRAAGDHAGRGAAADGGRARRRRSRTPWPMPPPSRATPCWPRSAGPGR